MTAEHVAQHRDADLKSDPGEKTDQHRARKEVGEKSQLEDPRQQQKAGGQQRHHADQRHVLLAGGRSHLGQRTGKDDGRRRIRSHDEMAGRTEHRERDQRQQHGVKSSDQGRAGDARITQHLRDIHRRKGHTRENVAHRRFAVEGP